MGMEVAQKLIKAWKWTNPHWTVTAATVQPQSNLSNNKPVHAGEREEVEPKAETIVVPSPFAADPAEWGEWEAAPTAEATCHWRVSVEERCRNLQGKYVRGTLWGFPASHYSWGFLQNMEGLSKCHFSLLKKKQLQSVLFCWMQK